MVAMTLPPLQIEVGNHTIAIYSDTDQKVNHTLTYLKEGLEHNEALILITADITKDAVRGRMTREWGVDVEELEERGDIVLQTPDEWYFRDGRPNWRRTDAMFLALQKDAIGRGRSGLRGAGDTRLFFEKGYVTDLIDYESSLERRFSISFTPLCTYSKADFDKLSSDQVRRLRECHYHFAVT